MARLLAAGSALALAAILAVAGNAWAHGALKSSAPAAGSHLDRVPREIRLTFNENAERAFTRISLVSSDGSAIVLGPVTIPTDSPRVAFATISDVLAPGVYAVRWQFAGRDGHPVRGNFKFTVAPGARVDTALRDTTRPRATDTMAPHHPPTSIPDNPQPGTFDAESPLFAFVRWLTFLGAFGVIGAVAFRYVVIGRMSGTGSAAGLALLEPALTRAAAIGLSTAVLLLLASIARLYAQSVAMHGASAAFEAEPVGSMITMTLWGRAWMLQVVGAITAIAGFFAVRRGRFAGWAAVAVATIAIALSLSLSGHAPASPRWSGAMIASDTLHVFGAAGWLGSLFFVVAAGITASSRLATDQRGAAVADLVNSFSPTALLFAGLAGLTGLFAAWVHLERVSAFWTSDYGRTLLIKLAVLAIVAGTGAYNWLRVRPALGDELGIRRIRRSATMEILVAAAVLAITSVLVATATPASRLP